MTAAVILLWTSCLWSIARSMLCLLWVSSPLRKLVVLATLALAAAYAHRPGERPA